MTETEKALGKIIGMVVHDLRNPGATIGANVSYIKESIEGGDPEVIEALDDVERALGDLMMGLEQIAWIGRWLNEEPPFSTTAIDLAPVLAGLRAPPTIDLVVEPPAEPLFVQASPKALGKLLQIFVENAVQHARRGVVRVTAERRGAGVAVQITDEGIPLALELHDAAFTLAGQLELKGRADGRYGRVVGLFAARVIADALGATLEADQADGRAVWRIVLRS